MRTTFVDVGLPGPGTIISNSLGLGTKGVLGVTLRRRGVHSDPDGPSRKLVLSEGRVSLRVIPLSLPRTGGHLLVIMSSVYPLLSTTVFRNSIYLKTLSQIPVPSSGKTFSGPGLGRLRRRCIPLLGPFHSLFHSRVCGDLGGYALREFNA